MKEGLEFRRLGDVADVYDGPHATPSTVDYGPVFLGIGSLKDGVIDLGDTRHVTRDDFALWTRRVRPQAGDIVFSYETRLGQAAIIPEGLECCLGRRMGLIRFRDENALPRYFLYQYLSPQFREFLDTKTIRGATVDRLSIKEFPSFPVAFPPLPEQQRIVALLDEAFAGLATAKANAERNLRNARSIFANHLEAVFRQRGHGWAERKLRDVCTLINGRAYKKDEMLDSGKYPLLRVGNFFGNRDWYYSDLDLDDDKYCDEGDLLYAWSASFGPRIWEGGKVIYHYHIWKVIPKESIADKRFLLYLLEWDVDQIKVAHGTGTTMMHVSKGSMEDRVVPVPPLSLQSEIVSRLDSLRDQTQSLAQIYERKLTALEELKKSLLQQAFNGEL